MKKRYTAPTIEEISFCLADALNRDVIHQSFEKNGLNKNWDFNEMDNEDDFSDLFM